MAQDYDVVIIGGGVAGLTAGLFTARHGHRTVIIERLMGGGQIVNAERIENYPGFPKGVAGFELGPLVQEQAMDAGAEVAMAEATALRVEGHYKLVETSEGVYRARAVIIAGGSTLRRLGIPGEAELEGRGVSHCATCDGPFFQDQTIGVVGGGDSALDEALTLTSYGSQVVVFHRRDAFRAQKALQERALGYPKVRVRWNSVVERVLGQDAVQGVEVRNVATGEKDRVDLSGLFIYVGLDPNTAYLKGTLSMDNAGHIATDIWMATSVPGVFAAGDIRQHSAAQVVTAAGDGATAAIAAHLYIGERKGG